MPKLLFTPVCTLGGPLGPKADVALLDFSKAFDKVGHQRVVEKLKWYGISGNTNK